MYKSTPNIKLASKQDCTGCSACSTTCPTNSIVMRKDNEGFLQPSIDPKTCIECHKCEHSCPIISPKPIDISDPNSYVARSNSDNVLKQSTSGGIFYTLAEWIINKKGVVFGARFNEQWELVHDYTETIEGLKPFMRSKYIQSSTGDTFKQAKQFLQQGRYVLFVGTPCQIGGLKSYLHKEYDNLLLVDFVCHGVPSPKIWKKYLKEKCSTSEVSYVSFRDKEKGWDGLYEMKINYGKKSYRSDSERDEYLYGFLNNYSLRQCCYSCKFKSRSRHSDITIADAWGVEEYMPTMYSKKGASLVLIHTLKGNQIYSEISNLIMSQHVEIDAALQYNRRATTSVPHTHYRAFFFVVTKWISVKSAIRAITWLQKEKKRLVAYKQSIRQICHT